MGVVCHDAGGAELVSRIIRLMEMNWKFSIDGPALKVFKRNIGTFQNLDLAEAVESSTELICGTSWQSTHENQALYLAKQLGKKTISVIDHYSCYRERFLKQGFDTLPDEIWVTDVKSFKLAQSMFPEIRVFNVGNIYLKEMKEEFNLLRKPKVSHDICRVLFLSEPYLEQAFIQHGDPNFWGFNEFDALNFLLLHLEKVAENQKKAISIRLHPSEKKDKYDEFIKKAGNFDIKTSANDTLLSDLVASDVIVGIDSMAMLLAVNLGMKVYSALPHCAIEPTLSDIRITYLRDL